MSHELVEKTAGLASRVDDLVTRCVGDECREFEKQQAHLEKLTLAAISAKLDESSKKYTAALAALTDAIDTIDKAKAKIEKISQVIKLTAKAAELVEKALKAAA